jgi:uncharacterized short protein YbdD (DUF466 family)
MKSLSQSTNQELDTRLRIGYDEYEEYSKKINPQKATGPDSIPMSLIRRKAFWRMLVDVANEMLAGRGTPAMWGSRLVLLDKRKNAPTSPPTSDDIRQIAIQNLVSKLAEHRILKELRLQIGTKLCLAQCGFIPGKET